MSELAIDAVDVSKKFTLGRRSTSLRDRLTGFSMANTEEFWAFQNVSVQVPKGTMLGIIGRNGSGKSTFLRTLCGVYRPTKGHVTVRGRVTALLELGAGFHNELTGRENIYMNGSVVGLDRNHMDSVMDEIIDMADIGSFIDAPLETYSSGMRARLGFAVSVQMQPEILLADEITAVGDIAFKEHGLARMNDLRDRGATIVQVSHNLAMLEKSCDQVLWLHHGEVRRIGNPKEIIGEYQKAAATDSSGRIIEQSPRSVARKAKQAAVTQTLAAEDKNSSWFQTVRFHTPGRDDLVAGGPATITLSIQAGREILDPAIEVRVLAAGGTPTGFGYTSGVLDEDAFDSSGNATLEASVDLLTLAAGRYNLRVDLCSGGAVVASRTQSAQVVPTETSGANFVTLPSTWRIAATR